MVDTETGGWKYEHGLIDTESCDLLGQTERYHLTLSQLIGLSGDVGLGCVGAPPYDPPLPKATPRVVIAQGWALTYFLMSFDVEDDGLVRIGSLETPVQGRYRAGFLRYMDFMRKGRDGKRHEGKNAFMEAFNLDNDSLQIMEKDFAAYQEFLVRKKRIRHIRKKRLLRWSDTSHGKLAGRREDDLLRQ